MLRSSEFAVYDFADALQWDWGAGGLLRRQAPKALVAVQHANRVIAGNPVLADWASQHNGDVVVIPSCVAPRRLPVENGLPDERSIGADQLALSYQSSFDLPVVIARPFNTYGPRQSARAVIPTIITQALTRDEIHLGSLEPTRDLFSVDDTIRGLMLCAEADRVAGEVINLGTGTEISVGEIAKLVIGELGIDTPTGHQRNARGHRAGGSAAARRRDQGAFGSRVVAVGPSR